MPRIGHAKALSESTLLFRPRVAAEGLRYSKVSHPEGRLGSRSLELRSKLAQLHLSGSRGALILDLGGPIDVCSSPLLQALDEFGRNADLIGWILFYIKYPY